MTRKVRYNTRGSASHIQHRRNRPRKPRGHPRVGRAHRRHARYRHRSWRLLVDPATARVRRVAHAPLRDVPARSDPGPHACVDLGLDLPKSMRSRLPVPPPLEPESRRTPRHGRYHDHMAPAAKHVGLVWRPHSGCHARDRAVRLAHRARAPRRRTTGGHTPSGRRPRGPKALTGSCASKPCRPELNY
jgi:hypothetical protein